MTDQRGIERTLFASYDSPARPTVLGSVDGAIEAAKNQSFGIRTVINGVEVFVTRDSEAELIGRDFLRVISGLAESPVSPYPAEQLKDEEALALDEAIGAGGLAGWITRQRRAQGAL